MSFIEQFQKYSIPLLTNGVELPKFEIPSECYIQYNIPRDISDCDFLEILCKDGMIKKGLNNKKEYQERFKLEFNAFKELGFCGYVLITWDIMRFCWENNIASGFARGSAASSLVLYLIGVTKNVDPLKNNLYFERFLSKTRAKFKEINGVRCYDGSLLMDIDNDISFKQRHQVIEYIDNKYKNRTSKLLTVSTLTSKILIKEIIKVYLGKNEDEANIISDSIPKIFGKVSNIEESIKDSKEFADFAKNNEEAILIAKKLHGLYLHYGVHPSAVVISANPIGDMIPLQLTKDKELITGYSMDDTLNLAAKVDILGLRSATLIENVCKLINIKPEDINVEDSIIYDNLKNLICPHGIFQIEADCNYKVLQKIKPRNLDDLSAIVAISRPGALQFTDSYSEYVKTGERQSVHQFIDDVFLNTGGNCIYQEQLMKSLNKIGFSLEESETCRKIIGKKKLEEVKEWEQKIKTKVKENNLPLELGDIIWRVLNESASYSFCAAHAYAYATMSAATTYLKFKYPKEFFVTLLQLSQDEPNPIEEVSKIYKELPYFGIELLPPHILKSQDSYSIEGDNIRMGLSSVKSISDKALANLSKFRNKYSNKFDIFQAANSAGLNISVVSALILVGSLDDMLTETRALTQLEYVLWNLLTDKEKNWAYKLGAEYNYHLVNIVKVLNEKIVDEKGKMVIKDSRRLTLRKKFAPYLELYNYNKKNELLCNHYFESLLLGFSYSTTLFDIYKPKVENLISIQNASSELKDSKVVCVGKVKESSSGTSRVKKTPYLKLEISDGIGSVRVMMFNTQNSPNIDSCKELNANILPKEDDIVIIEGKKMEDNCIFASNIRVQDIKVFDKISKLPQDKLNE